MRLNPISSKRLHQHNRHLATDRPRKLSAFPFDEMSTPTPKARATGPLKRGLITTNRIDAAPPKLVLCPIKPAQPGNQKTNGSERRKLMEAIPRGGFGGENPANKLILRCQSALTEASPSNLHDRSEGSLRPAQLLLNTLSSEADRDHRQEEARNASKLAQGGPAPSLHDSRQETRHTMLAAVNTSLGFLDDSARKNVAGSTRPAMLPVALIVDQLMAQMDDAAPCSEKGLAVTAPRADNMLARRRKEDRESRRQARAQRVAAAKVQPSRGIVNRGHRQAQGDLTSSSNQARTNSPLPVRRANVHTTALGEEVLSGADQVPRSSTPSLQRCKSNLTTTEVEPYRTSTAHPPSSPLPTSSARKERALRSLSMHGELRGRMRTTARLPSLIS